MSFLKVKGMRIVDSFGKPVILSGVNLGGWLNMEAYILHAPNFAEQIFKSNFKKELGNAALLEFEESFRSTFITEEDFKKIKGFGFNCIRLPFHYKIVENRNISYLDKALQWAAKYKIWVILDLHAAPGAQNHDWHSDSDGRAALWTDVKNQEKAYKIWEKVADKYKDNVWVAGYDLLNEAVLDDTNLLNKFYKNLIKKIRAVDKNHILFIEGNRWGIDIECLEEFKDDNYVISVHNYEPLQFTFNFTPGLKYPLRNKEFSWNKGVNERHLAKYKAISKSRNVPVFVGEFGVNYRDGLYGEDIWLKEVVNTFKALGFSWTYWTYKAVKHYMFPDGLFSYYRNSAWVNRQGPKTGWDTYASLWNKNKKEIAASWKTDNFRLNKEIAEVLKRGI